MPKSASIYERTGILYVSAAHRTEAGFWISDCNITALESSDFNALGMAIEVALARSLEGVPTPLPSADLTSSLLAAAGVTSWNVFAKSARYVSVRQDGALVKVTPYKNSGTKDGFVPLHDKAITLPFGDDRLAYILAQALEVAD